MKTRAPSLASPDCLVLVGRLLAGRRVPRRRKLLLVALLGYLALAFDLIPDFQLGDVIVVVYVPRRLFRRGGEPLLREHWPEPEQSLRLVLRLASKR